jgi:hypothetical protein
MEGTLSPTTVVGVQIREHDDDEEEPRGPAPEADFAWGRTANPNTVDGELQNLAAFGAGLTRLSGPRRMAARIVVSLVLLGLLLAIVYSAVSIIRSW